MKCSHFLRQNFIRLTTPSSSSSSSSSSSPFSTPFRRLASLVSLNDGSRIPQVGLGTWKSPPGSVGAAVAAALDAGYRHIDCALVYQNEDEIGETLSKKLSSSSSSASSSSSSASSSSSPSLRREDIFLTSKIWNTFHSRSAAREGLERTLRSLRTSYLDLLLIHYPFGFDESGLDADGEEDAHSLLYPLDARGAMRFSDVDYLETYAALESFVAEGLVKSVGVSNFNAAQLERVLKECSVKPVTNQVEVHPYFVNAELIAFCQSHSVVVTAYSPLGSPDRPNAQSGDPVLLFDPVVAKIAEKRNKSPAQVFGLVIRMTPPCGLETELARLVCARAFRLASSPSVCDFVGELQ